MTNVRKQRLGHIDPRPGAPGAGDNQFSARVVHSQPVDVIVAGLFLVTTAGRRVVETVEGGAPGDGGGQPPSDALAAAVARVLSTRPCELALENHGGRVEKRTLRYFFFFFFSSLQNF